MLRTFKNADSLTRTWTHLTDPETGSTLELEPGATVDLDLPDDFEDVYLVPVVSGVRTRKTPAIENVAGPEAQKESES